MYGNASGVTGATLAATGVSTGSWVLSGVGLILAGVAFWLLVRKNGKDKP